MKLDPGHQQKFEFNVEVEGAELSELKPRLLLKEADLSLLIEGTASNSKFIFQTPVLSKRITATVVEGKVEVLVRDRLLTVWEGQFEIVRTPVVKVTEASVDGVSINGGTVIKAVPVEYTAPIKPVAESAPVTKPVEYTAPIKPVVEAAAVKPVHRPAPVKPASESKRPQFARPIRKAKSIIDHTDPVEQLIDSAL